MIWKGGAGIDHPVDTAHPEGEYLKASLLVVEWGLLRGAGGEAPGGHQMGDRADGAKKAGAAPEREPESRAKQLQTAVELRLNVRDPEVVAQLTRFTEGEERDAYALTALRIGVLSMRMAGGQVDAATVRETGKELLSEIRDLLTERSSEMTGKVSSALKQYFDPSSGLLQQRIDSFVRKDGELERVLRDHLGPEDSTVAKSLARYLGENSPVFRMLSPTDSEGIRAQVQGVLETALEEQREKVVGQFSLDNGESALSRLLAEIGRKQGNLGEDLKGQIETLTKEFSSDAEGSALNRLSELLKQADERIAKNLTLDREDSPLSLLKRSLEETLRNFERDNSEFQKEVRKTLTELRVRKDEASRSTRHGLAFEEQLGSLISMEAQRMNDVFEATGNTTGMIKNCKKGDHVVTLGPESVTPGSRIAWEAKEDKSYTLSRALGEMEEARKNRSAQVGVFVFSRLTAPEGMEALARYGPDVVVTWDAEDPSSDLFVKAAYSVARALTVRTAGDDGDLADAASAIEAATRAVEKQIKYLSQFSTWAGTIISNAGQIRDRSNRMREDLAAQIEVLDRSTNTLNGLGA